ncbi:hypothetical protein Ahy_A02g006936 isoform A [Arachis hypogaea]|uniref:Aminotransferase-like plant mobile domain-containing protein n=1 Tax=Arachis hypogaea TaxID=3818 RepID=A0A445EB54_ARAHY|nr:hypothetical protein Ahy_A02g006936 isoform A [Arachis hypogaea]
MLHYVTDWRVSVDRQVQQPGAHTVATASPGLRGVLGLSWGSTVLAWTYQSLCLVAQQGVTDIADCTLLLMNWIYQRFSQWCLPDRGVYQYPLAARLVGLQQQSTDQHQAKLLYYRVSIDRLRFDEVCHENKYFVISFYLLCCNTCYFVTRFFIQFAWRVYDDPALQALCPLWFFDRLDLSDRLSLLHVALGTSAATRIHTRDSDYSIVCTIVGLSLCMYFSWIAHLWYLVCVYCYLYWYSLL